MPSGENWQGDVLRNLRSGPPTADPRDPDQPPAAQGTPGAPGPAQGTPHPAPHHTQGAAQPQQGSAVPHPTQAPQGQQGPGAPQPAAAAPQGFPGHPAAQPGQTAAYGYPHQAQAPHHAGTPQGQAPAYGYPGPDPAQRPGQAAAPQGFPGSTAVPQGHAPAQPGRPQGPDQAQAANHAPAPQGFPGNPAAYGYPGPDQAQGPGHAAGPQHGFPGHPGAQPGQAAAYGYPGPAQAQHPGQATGPQGFPGNPAARHGQAAAGHPQGPGQAQAPNHAAGPQGQAPAYGYPGPGHPQGPGHTAGPWQGHPGNPAARQGETPAYPDRAAHGASHSAAPQGQAHAHPGPAQAQAQPQRARTPDSRPSVDQKVASAGRKPLHGEAFSARATRAVRRIVSSSAAREVAEATRAAELLQAPVTTGRQIAVTSIRGGAGKSTVAALLGTTYAHYRQDPVLFVEADPALGSLPIRLGAESLRWTTGDIADIVEPQMSLLDITGYLVQLRDNAWLLPGSQGQIGAMLDARSYERAMVALRRYFGVTVVDCETLPAEVARVALTASQARVLTTPATLDGVMSTYAVLQWMQGLPPHVIAGTVVVLTEQSPHSGIGLAEAVQSLESTGTSVHVLPYDRHLAAGGRIRTELLAHSTRQTAARLAADVFQLSQQRH